jgi:hypothetical protein
MAEPTIHLSRAEFLWLSFGVWLGGVFILAVMPILLIPRLGIPGGVAASYLVFFLAWQPVQSVTQRALGMRAAVLRMLIFVAGAATLAYYVREMLLAR